MDCNFELIKQGAEARLYKTMYLGKPSIVKERFKKAYRNDILDEQILKERMKAEAKGLVRSKIAGVSTPALYLIDMESRRLFMEHIEGVTVKDYIDKLLVEDTVENNTELKKVTDKIGTAVGKIHRENLVHGDLTTSNMLVDRSCSVLYLIDFGLSYVSSSPEDQGVDLYVLERALTSTHASAEYLFQCIMSAYCRAYKNGNKDVLKKYEEVKARGRKRTMVG